MGKQHGQQGDRDQTQGGSRAPGEQDVDRPQQGRDVQRNKQSDRGTPQQSQEDATRQMSDRQDSGNRQQRQEDVGKSSSQGQPSEGRRQSPQNVYGEGNYAASRQYNRATKDFVESGKVESAARDAAPRSDADAAQMAAAEAEGRRHAKGEDPALNRRPSRQQVPESPTPRPGREEE